LVLWLIIVAEKSTPGGLRDENHRVAERTEDERTETTIPGSNWVGFLRLDGKEGWASLWTLCLCG